MHRRVELRRWEKRGAQSSAARPDALQRAGWYGVSMSPLFFQGSDALSNLSAQ